MFANAGFRLSVSTFFLLMFLPVFAHALPNVTVGPFGPGTIDGSEPFDIFDGCADANDQLIEGEDCGESNLVVRNQDVVSHVWSVTADNYTPGQDNLMNVVLEQTITPSANAEILFESIPVACQPIGGGGDTPASAIADNGDGSWTLTCNLGEFTEGAQESITVGVKISGNSQNGSDYTSTQRVYSLDGGGNANATEGTSAPVGPIKISAQPAYDLVNSISPTAGFNTGYYALRDVGMGMERGFYVYKNIRLAAARKTGIEAIQQPYQFKDVFSVTALAEDGDDYPLEFHITECRDNPSLWNGEVYGKATYNPTTSDGEIHVADSGTCAFERTDALGNPSTDPTSPYFDFTVSDTDLSGNKYPTLAYSTIDLSAGPYYAANHRVQIFVPFRTVDMADGVMDDQGSVYISSVLNDFDPDGTSGVSNYGGDLEPGYNGALVDGLRGNNRLGPTALTLTIDGSFSKRNLKYADDKVTSYEYAGEGSYHAGDGELEAGQSYVGWVLVYNTGSLGHEDPMVCDVFDNTTQVLTDRGNTGGTAGTYAYMGTYAPEGFDYTNYIVEYGHTDLTGDDPIDIDHDSSTNNYDISTGRYQGDWAKAEAARCGNDDAQGGWFTDPTQVPGGIDAVNMVRARLTDAAKASGVLFEPGQQMRFAIPLQSRDNFKGGPHDGEMIPVGTVLANFASTRSDTWATDWTARNYSPSPETGSVDGDRVTLTRIQARLDSESLTPEAAPGNTASTLAGEQVVWKITSAVQSTLAEPSDAENLRIVNVLPPEATYSSTCTAALADGTPPNLVEYNTDQDGNPALGYTRLLWNFGDVTANTPIAPRIFCTDTDPLALHGTSVPIYSEIRADNIISSLAVRSDTHTIKLEQTGSIQVSKKVDMPLDDMNDDQVYTISWANFAPAFTIHPPTIIDVLPFTSGGGDGMDSLSARTPESDFNGKLELTAAPTVSWLDDSMPDTGAGDPHAELGIWHYSADAPQTINYDPDINAAEGTTNWCLEADFNTGACPADFAAVTALKFVSNYELAKDGDPRQGMKAGFTLQAGDTVDPNSADANLPGDIYTNRFTFDSTSLPADQFLRSNNVSVEIAAFSIGDLVFADVNGNGKYDAGTDGVVPDGVTVELYQVADDDSESKIRETTTGIVGPGRYLFEPLASGKYYVKIPATEFQPGGKLEGWSEAPPTGTNRENNDENEHIDQHGYSETTPQALGIRTDTVELNANPPPPGGVPTGNEPTGDNVLPITDPTGDDFSNLTLDIGLNSPLSSLGNAVWIDSNNNGLQDPGEVGLSYVTVNLLDAGGNILQTTRTDNSGYYSFSGLVAGTYVVEVIKPAGYEFSPQDSVADDTADSDTSTTDGRTVPITLEFGQHDTQWDSGLYPLGSIGDRVWIDNDANGLQDIEEAAGIVGVNITLKEAGGDVIAATTTNDDGEYLFSDLPPGNYTVGVDTTNPSLEGYNLTTANDPYELLLAAGEDYRDADFGYVNYASVGDTVWHDLNGDGVQNGEPGVVGAAVRLLEPSSGTIVKSTTTGANGEYLIEDVIPGDYVIEFVQPNDYSGFVANDLGGDDALDSDVVGSSGKTGTFNLGGGEARTDIDAGLYKSATLGDLLWLDEDGNAARGADEPGLPGTQVTLTGTLGDGSAFTPISVVTDENGQYQFSDLYPGDYTVTFADTGFVTADQGGDDELDSDVAPNGAANVTLASGDNNQTIDAGIAAAAVTGRVWIDNNTEDAIDNGTANEDGVVGVTANLIDAATGVVVATTTTGVEGVYTFSGVKPDNYLVEIVEPANMGFVAQDQGGDDTTDSDVNTVTGHSEPFALAAGQTVTDVDAGIEPGSLGDHVTLDMNDNGVQDAGEPGVKDIVVTLLDVGGNTVDTQNTDATGFYNFTGVAPGNYTVHFEALAGMEFADADVGINDTVDFDTNAAGDVSVTVVSGEGNQTIDAGIVPATLGDTVWFDSNGNGVQDTGEPGIADIVVTLLDDQGNPVQDAGSNDVTTTTDSDGQYNFSVLPETYAVAFTLPADMAFTTKDSGGDDDKDSDADVNGHTATTTLQSGDSDMSLDAGVAPATVSGTVLSDANGNGTEEAGDTGIETVTVTLSGTDVLGNPVELTTTTDDKGDYGFVVMPGTYSISETNPNGLTSSGSEAGTVGSTVVNDDKLEVTLKSGDNSTDNDFLDYEPASLSGQVREDSNADGDTTDSADTGIGGVEIILWQDTNGDDTPDSVFANTTTNPNGEYSFLDIPPGNYVVIESDLSDYTSTADTAGDNDNRVAVTLGSGETSPNHDFLDTRPANISGQVRDDADRDGDMNDTELGIPGLTISLYTDPNGDGDPANGTLVTTTTTNAQGEYQFNNVLPGDYIVVEADPDDYESTADTEGANDNVIPVSHVSAQDSHDNDFLDASLLGSLSGTVWYDSNADGSLASATEDGIPGVEIWVQNESGVTVATILTDPDGNYEATDLPAGNYTVIVDPTTLPPQMLQTGDPDGALDHLTSTQVVAGENTPDLDFGYVGGASIGDTVWEDLNGNGVQDVDEPGVKNIVVVLLKDGAEVATTSTGSDGNYRFDDLLPGDYDVSFELPVDYYLTAANQGGDDGLDSDPSVDGKVSVTVASGEDLSVDAGIYRLGALGDRVWLDMNSNGVQDADEPAISDMVVNLLTTSGDPQRDSTGQPISTQVNEDGLYLFTDLQPGDYLVEFVAPAGISFTEANQGLDDGLDSDAQPNGQAPATVISGQTNRGVDAGIVPAAVSGRVWIDNNTPNSLDEGAGTENGVVGVAVNLIDADTGEVVATTTTGPDGVYDFTGIEPGDYLVQVIEPANMGFVFPDQGLDDTIDSDVDNNTGRSAVFNLTSGAAVADLDAGIEPGALGDHVFLDENQNGLQDSGEPGVEDVVVKLIDSNSDVVETQTTDATGFYDFGAELPGEYTIEFTLPDGMSFTTQDMGSDDTVDSDPDSNGQTTVTVISGVGNQTIDAGVVPALIGDTVWMDTDGDGTQGGSEPVIANVMVSLLDDQGVLVLDNGGNNTTTTTDATGYYEFIVEPGTYSVQFTLPDGVGFTAQYSGSNDESDSDADVVDGETASVTVNSGDANRSLDAGIQSAVISGVVLQDNNGDGAENGADTPLENVTVTLEGTDVFGNPVTQTVTTGENGSYAFDVPPGTYTVAETNPDEFISSGAETGVDDTVVNDDLLEVTVTSGETALGNDFLDYQPASLSGQVREDVNGDADTADATDPAISGVSVLLWRDEDGDGSSDSVVAGTNTDDQGEYQFTDLPPGNYIVIETDESAYQSTADTGDVNDNRIAVPLASDETSIGNDFLDTRPTMISGAVIEDTNRNGGQDDNESGMDDVVVTLYTDPNGDGNPEDGTPVATTETDEEGNYVFTEVLPGNYVVVESDPDNYESTGDTGGEPADNLIPVTNVSGENNTRNNFLDTKNLGSVSGVIWNDLDGDGVQGTSEPEFQGITVHLLDEADDVVATTTTNPQGGYSFTDQLPGDYTVLIPENAMPVGYGQTADPDVTLNNNHPITIVAQTDHTDVNFGYAAFSDLGDRVWHDANANGIQDEGEQGIPGVMVRLYSDPNGDGNSDDGTLIAANSTNSNGDYLFTGLLPDQYVLHFEELNDYFITASEQGDDRGVDSNIDQDGYAAVTLTPIGSRSIDAGFWQYGSLGNRVWLDANSDGYQDVNEASISDVEVSLLDETGQSILNNQGQPVTTVTGANGEYYFDNLQPGEYQVSFTTPDGITFTQTNRGSDDSVDSDADANGVAIAVVTSGVHNDTVDAGLVPAAVSGRIWIDNNTPNGVDDGTGNENGLVGIVINLIDDNGEVVQSTTSGPDGSYSFTAVLPGEYQVEFVEPDNMSLVDANQGDDETRDSDADPVTGLTAPFTLTSGQGVSNLDAGMEPGALGDRVWLDTNFNGVQDANEPGVPGIEVHLLDKSGLIVASTTTDDDGFYSFNQVVPGDYTIRFERPANADFVVQDAGSDDTADSDVDAGGVAAVTVQSGKTGDQSIDAGIVPVLIGDRVWLDINGDGLQSDGEPGLEGITVNLLDAKGDVLDSTTTDKDGLYQFATLPGQWQVSVQAPDSRYTESGVGVDGSIDSDVNEQGVSGLLSVSSGEQEMRIDAGILPGIIKGSVVEDNNAADGAIDDKDVPMAGVTIVISGTDSYGNPISTTVVTDENGKYEVALPPGSYTVTETQPDGYESSGSNAPATGGSEVKGKNELLIKLESDWIADNSNFLDYRPAVVLGTIMTDPNGDGDTSDGSPRSGVTVQLFSDPDGDGDTSDGTLIGTAVTGTDGEYYFDDLTPGDYVLIRKSTDGSDEDEEVALNLGSGKKTDGELEPVDNETVSFSGSVKEDSNNDGKLDDNDKGLPGVIVTLHTDPNADGNQDDGKVVTVTTTDGNGEFDFDNVELGSYVVVETDPFGFISIADSSGVNDNRVPVVLTSGYKPLGIGFLDIRDDNTPPHTGGSDTVQIPTLTEWALIMLSMLMLLVAAAGIRKQH